MKSYKLDAEERDILKRFENGEFVSSDEDKEVYIAAARETLRRRREALQGDSVS